MLLNNNILENISNIPKKLILDKNLSDTSLRLILYLFTKPENWEVNNTDVCNFLGITEQTLSKKWKELINSGYIKRKRKKSEDGKFNGSFDYIIGIIEENEDNFINENEIKRKIKTSKIKLDLNELDEFDDEVKDLFLEYLEMRELNKIKTTQKILKRLIFKFKKFGSNNEIIEKAINGNWRDFYEIKSYNYKTNNNYNKKIVDTSII